MGIEFRVDLSDVEDGFRKLERNLRKNITEGLTIATDKAISEAKSKHRFVTRSGTLLNSLLNQTRGYTAKAVISDAIAPYGKYIHEGHRSWAPDPFLEDAFKKHEVDIVREVEDQIDSVIKKAGF